MYKHVAVATLLLSAGMLNSVQAQTPVAGKDYVEIQDPDPPEHAEGQVVIEEFFNYICPACNAFEPSFVAWQQDLPDYVKVVHVPAAFRQDFEPYARAYYAAETLGLTEKTHQAVYNAIHISHSIPAEGDRIDMPKIAAFYAKYGVDADEFLDVMQSFGVNLKLRQTEQHMRKLRVSSTPTLVVNGRYRIEGRTYQDILRIASYLIEREHAG
jgi:thiol:disulfide interchange protein DsbA